MLSVVNKSEKDFSDIELVSIEKTKTGFQVVDEDSGTVMLTADRSYKHLIAAIVRHFNWTVITSSIHECSEFAILDETEENRKDEDISFRFLLQA